MTHRLSAIDYQMFLGDRANHASNGGAGTSLSQSSLMNVAASLEQLMNDLEALQSRKGITRAFLISKMRLQDTVVEAIDRYREASSDVAEAECCSRYVDQHIRGKHQTPLHDRLADLKARFSRHRSYWRSVLGEIDVRLDEVFVGEPFDPVRHKQIEVQTTSDATQKDTIAEIHSQRFVWRDEFGLEQSQPALVSVYTDEAVIPPCLP